MISDTLGPHSTTAFHHLHILTHSDNHGVLCGLASLVSCDIPDELYIRPVPMAPFVFKSKPQNGPPFFVAHSNRSAYGHYVDVSDESTHVV